ncbi:hypothetical protein [Streptomyces cinereospinus]|uniref:Integral membrane protein n=1 Tax=Streptomyces cinereospinus TaxID=285561 RepID=A0ABV5N250_9ACTN
MAMDTDTDTGRDPVRRRTRIVRGCAAAVVFAFAVLVVLFAFGGTIEVDTAPWLDQNPAPVVVMMLVIAVLVTAGGVLLSGPRSYAGWIAAACVAALVVLRTWTLAPMLHCWSYDSVGRNEDGSYRCLDRGDMLP